jgi:hypothetical protein
MTYVIGMTYVTVLSPDLLLLLLQADRPACEVTTNCFQHKSLRSIEQDLPYDLKLFLCCCFNEFRQAFVIMVACGWRDFTQVVKTVRELDGQNELYGNKFQ